MMENKRKSKQELRVTFSPEVYDELKYVFRPDQLENIIYKPQMLEGKKWSCSCGFENEIDRCPICGMEKSTVFSRVNASYLTRHRKARLEKRKNNSEQKKEMMASMLKKPSKKKKSDNKSGIIIGVVTLCIAVFLCALIIFGTSDKTRKKPDATDTATTVNKDTTASQTESPTETGKTPDTTEHQPVSTTPVNTEPPVTLPPAPDTREPIAIVPAKDNVATVEKGAYAKGASGNVSSGGRLFCVNEYDYIATDGGITVRDKDGKEISRLTSNAAIAVTGNASYIFYINTDNNVMRVSLADKSEISMNIKAVKIVCIFDTLYFSPLDTLGLKQCNPDGKELRDITNEKVSTVDISADKLYFATDKSLYVITSKEGPATSFCPDGANATSILEMDNYVFYTSNGNLRVYAPSTYNGFYKVYPLMTGESFTSISAFDGRVYFKAEINGTFAWYTSDVLFTTKTRLNIKTPSIYVTDKGIYDGNLESLSLS